MPGRPIPSSALLTAGAINAVDAMAFMLLATHPAIRHRPSPPQPRQPDTSIVAEFDSLLMALDDHSISREDWDNFRKILAIAAGEAAPDSRLAAEDALQGFLNAHKRWKEAYAYSGPAPKRPDPSHP
jgi:hypothetical protein